MIIARLNVGEVLRKRRIVCLIVAVGVIAAGLASRRYRSYLPQFLADYAGDTLWSVMVYALVSCWLVEQRRGMRAVVALGLAFLVEMSQLYHAPWIDTIRQYRLGGLVLGHGFLATDLICYAVGIGLAMTLEWILGPAAEQPREPTGET